MVSEQICQRSLISEKRGKTIRWDFLKSCVGWSEDRSSVNVSESIGKTSFGHRCYQSRIIL
jgi:hypothetical protein